VLAFASCAPYLALPTPARMIVVTFLLRKVELRGQYGTVGRLEPDVVVTGSSRIQTRQNRLQRVPSMESEN
jgi:hypothetical protein